jgi:hypothetical protein
MNNVQVYSIEVAQAPGYAWKWRSAGGAIESAQRFVYYYDCVSDAREQGYTVDLVRARGSAAPSGKLYHLA